LSGGHCSDTAVDAISVAVEWNSTGWVGDCRLHFALVGNSVTKWEWRLCTVLNYMVAKIRPIPAGILHFPAFILVFLVIILVGCPLHLVLNEAFQTW
jgi:hypothetical protein